MEAARSLRGASVPETSELGGRFGYSTNYLIGVERPIIVDVEATTALRQAEVLAVKRMIERSLDRFGLYPAWLMDDSAYGSSEMLGWLVYENRIEPHVTMFDRSLRKDGTFSPDDFTYDHASDVYRCPGGKMLTTTGTLVNDGATMLYCASKYDCQGRDSKARCCPKEMVRKIPRAINEGACDMARQIARSRGRQSLATAAQKDRDAVRVPQAHPQARPAQIKRPDRRSR